MKASTVRITLPGALVVASIAAIGTPHAQAQTFGGFAPDVTFPVGTGPLSVALGDLDGNGSPDLAVANFNSHNVSILINQGIVCLPSPPSHDFNGDGVIDAGDLANLLANWGVLP